MSSEIHRRQISERSFLSELNLELAISVGCHLAKERPSSIDYPAIIQDSADQIIARPQYSEKKIAMQAVIKTANEIYPQMRIKADQINDPELWKALTIAKTQIALLKAFGWEARKVSLNDFPYPMSLGTEIPVELLSCFEYALSYSGVDEAFPVTWQAAELPDLLTKKWGFKTVSKEKSRPGDIVLYLDKGVATHMGVRYKDKVLSKPGNEQMFVFAHELDEAFSCYGDEIRFYRKALLN
ncbi:MAG: hypothetical protein K1X28_00190 [Parachlamydiales bacterium]|nr:hypothetical protein [Parachlamydiales bacterium]